MKFIDSVIIAIKSLLANKLRSSLTMLGIIIGVGAVITLMAVGRGAQETITSTFEDLGTNTIYVQPRNPDAPGVSGLAPAYALPTLTLADAEAISELPFVLSTAPVNENFTEITAGNESAVAVIHGSTPGYQQAFNYTIDSGQFFSDRDVAKRDSVVVLGSKVSETLFGSGNAIGETVKIKGKRFTVIGVLASKGGSLFGISFDDVMVVPITTYQVRLFAQAATGGEDTIQSLSVQVAAPELMNTVSDEIEDLLRKRHHIMPDEKDDFGIMTQDQMLGLLEQITGVFTIFLGSIASISLIVGSIGIMNIMLVSVTERTREIGIRKAIGAKRRDILLQFLFEAATIGFIGGGMGIIGGWLVAAVISQIDAGGLRINAVVTPDIVILAVSVSIGIGLASGIYPAMRAARLNPIDALRYG